MVIQLQVQNLDTQMMAEIKAEEKRQEWGLIRLITMAFLYWLLRVLGAKHLKTLDEEILPNVVQKKMEPMLNEMLQIKLEEEMKVDAETLVLSEDKQARYFYNKLKEIRSATKKGV